MGFGRYKVIQSGSVVELYEYENYVKFGEKKKKKESAVDTWEKEEGVSLEEIKEKRTKEEMRKYSRTRTRNMIRRQCLANFSKHSKFITLTFADNPKIDINNVEETNKEFKKFIQRMRRAHDKTEIKKGREVKKEFKYLAVIEFQDTNDRGAVHYHMICDLPYIPVADLAKKWGLGFVRINDISNVDNVGAYISAYINKDVNDTRLDGKKVYLTSKNMLKPRELRGIEAIKYIRNMKLTQKKAVCQSSYTSEYCGEIKYKEYNLKRNVTETKDLNQIKLNKLKLINKSIA